MRHYEIMLLIHPDQSERARVMMERYVGIIESGEGRIHRNEDLGRRMLAYPVAKVQKAHYMLLNVECGQETLNELVGALHFSDAVLRHLVVRRDEAVTEQSALARAAEREAARENREYPYDREVAHGRRKPDGDGHPDKATPRAAAEAESEEAENQADAREAPAEAPAAEEATQPAADEAAGEEPAAGEEEAAPEAADGSAEDSAGAQEPAEETVADEPEAAPEEDSPEEPQSGDGDSETAEEDDDKEEAGK